MASNNSHNKNKQNALLSLSLLLTTAILSLSTTTTAWTTTTTTITTPMRTMTSTTKSTSSTTALFGKKKKKDTTISNSSVNKIQVKLLQHIAGTGQAGDVIMVNPIFFDNKLRPQKLARKINDDEVQNDIENKQENTKQCNQEATTIVQLLGTEESSSSSKQYTLSFLDNQTGPDGLKLFGGIGPKKLLDALKLDCNEFDLYSKEHTKLVSIVDVLEEEEMEKVADDKPAFKTWKDDDDDDDDNDDNATPSTTFKSLPKSDKLTIKRTGIYQLKVALTKEINVMIRVIVE